MWTERGQNRNQWAVDAQALHSLHCCDTINSPSFSHTSAEATASGEASPHNISEHKHWLWAITIMPFKFKLHFNWGSIQEAELQFKFESKEVDLKWIEIQSRLSHELSKLKTSDKMIDRQTDRQITFSVILVQLPVGCGQFNSSILNSIFEQKIQTIQRLLTYSPTPLISKVFLVWMDELDS